MPFTVIFEKQYKQIKKGFRARLAVPAFIRLRREGYVKRVATLPNDLKNKVIDPENYVSKSKTTQKDKKGVKAKKRVNPNSLKNLKKPGKKK